MISGTLYVIAAPSGAGKTSLVKALVERVDKLVVSVSHTTRSKRPGEQEGVDYHFISHDEFGCIVAAGEFLEHATVFGNSYGTTRAGVLERLEQGLDVILEIDWQGARQVRRLIPDCLGIFILPPSKDVLDARLRARGQDGEHTIVQRMQEAVNEMSHYHEFDYVVVNDEFERALEELIAIVLAARLRTSRRNLSGLLGNLLN